MKIVAFIRPYILQPKKWRGSSKSRTSDRFFFCFVDAVRYLFCVHGIDKSKNYKILLPDFYCPETTSFFASFGELIFYKTNDDLTIDKSSYFLQIEKNKPEVIINYSFVGFSLDSAERCMLKILAGQALIIDDCAHKIINVDRVAAITDNHYYVDSIRKHSPFFGSHIFGRQIETAPKAERINLYKLKCLFLSFFRNFFSLPAYLFRSTLFYRWSENLFDLLDNIVGEHKRPTFGGFFSVRLYNLIDSNKLIEHRRCLVKEYINCLGGLSSSLIKIPDGVKIHNVEVNYFPIFVDSGIQEKLIKYLADRKIFICKLWDIGNNPFNLNAKIYNRMLILPLEWLINSKDVARIFELIKDFCDKEKL